MKSGIWNYLTMYRFFASSKLYLVLIPFLWITTARPVSLGQLPDSINQLLEKLSPEKRSDTLIRMGDQLSADSSETAIKYALEAIRIAEKKDLYNQFAPAYRVVADAYYYLENYHEAIKNYLLSAEAQKNDSGEDNAFYINRLGDVGTCYDLMDQHDAALEYYGKALEIAKRVNNTDEMAANLANIGRIHTLKGNYGEAIALMEEALSIDEKTGNTEVIATDLNTVGRIYQSWGKDEEAIDYFLRAMQLDQEAGRTQKVAIRLNSMGLAYRELKQYSQAIDCFTKAIEIDRSGGDEEKVAVRMNNLGMTYAGMEQYEKAIFYLDQAIELFKKHQNIYDLAGTYLNIGQYHLRIKDYDRAEEYLMKSNSVASDNQYKPLQMNSLLSLSQLFREKGDYRKAMEYFEEYSRIKDEIFSEESDKRLADFMIKYETEKERQENELLLRDIQIRQKKHTITVILASSVVALLIFALIIYRLIALSNKHKRELAEQRAEKLNLELETRNKELTYNAMCIIKNNETMAKMIEGIEAALKTNDSPDHLRQILHGVRNMEKDNNWKEFEVRFTNVHKDFYTILEERYPDLTPNERKICAFLRLNMSTKDIANLTHQSVHSINVARTRLRKKLNLVNTDENLIRFLARL